MSTSGTTAAAAGASSTAADQTLTSAAAEAVRKRIQQALPPNSSPIDHELGSIKSQASLAPFWKAVQRSGGWLEPDSATAYAATHPSASLEDIIRNHTSAFVCNPLVRQQLHMAIYRFEFCDSCWLLPRICCQLLAVPSDLLHTVS